MSSKNVSSLKEGIAFVFSQAFEESPLPVAVTDDAGKIIYVNQAYQRLFSSWTNLYGSVASVLESEFHSPEFYQHLWETLKQKKFWRGKIIDRHPEGHLVTWEVSIFPLIQGEKLAHLIIFQRDVTWEEELENYQQQVAKLEAIAQLAGGIAHEFNNILAAISGYAELLLIKKKLEPEVHKAVEAIFAQARRASYLVSQLLDFSRQSKPEKIVFDLVDFLKEHRETFAKWLGNKIKFELELPASSLFFLGSPLQLKQVFFNLLVNAREAMKDGGTLTIALDETALPEKFSSYPLRKETSRWARLTIKDSGPGIDPRVARRIFEPFFSTKEEGSGLGLAQVYGIIREHNGFIRVSSFRKRGTTFEIFLPLVERDFSQKELFPWH